jgi:hypothetical protein
MIDRSQLPNPRSFYEQELSPARLGRPDRKGWCMSFCPFHVGRSGKPNFSVNLDTGGFRCFNPDCDVRGGIIKFVMLQHRCNYKRACQILRISDQPLSLQDRLQLEHQKKERQRKLEQQEQAAQQARQERLQQRDVVHNYNRIMREASQELEKAETEEEREKWWTVLSCCFELAREAEEIYMQMCGEKL